MDKKEIIRLGIAYVFVFFIALYIDMQGGSLENGQIIYRDESGGKAKKVELLLNVENILENYKVDLEIEPRRMTAVEAEECFSKAMDEIDEDVLSIESSICIKEIYADGFVAAEWSFSPSGFVGVDGVIQGEKIPEKGTLVTATVVLQCDNYEKVYCFPLQIQKPKMSLQEKIETELSDWIEVQQEIEGQVEFQLPSELAGISARWTEKKEYLSFKILFLEGISLILLFWARKKEKENAVKQSRQQKEIQYPEIVNQLLILMEAGMTTRQAWHRIAYQYTEKKKQNMIEVSEVYEAIVQMDRRLMEGETEKVAYDNFGNQMDSMCYRRLMRLIVHNLEKGNRDICRYLSLEAKQAYEQRVLLAKKLGEEASTKMLIPMMLMMTLVMIIVMAPAIMSFSV